MDQLTSAVRLALLGLLAVTAGVGSTLAQESRGYDLKTFLGITAFNEVAVAPDGRHVAFIASFDDFEEDRTETAIYLIEVDASGPTGDPFRLTYQSGRYSSLAWSRDSQYLAFLSNRGDLKASQLFILNLRGGEPLRLTDPERFEEGIAAYDWLPDGGLLFAAPIPRGEEEQEEWKEVYSDARVLPGRTPRTGFWRLAREDFGDASPDSLTALELNVTGLRSAPDGSRVVFTSGSVTDPEVFLSFEDVEVYVLPLEQGAQPQRLTRNLALEGGLVWSRDGGAVYLSVVGEPEADGTIWTQGRIYRIDATNGALGRLAADFEGSMGSPGALLPDGRLLTTGALSTRQNVYAIDTASGRAEPLSDYAGQVFGPSASDDGMTVAFTLITDESFPELYVARGVSRIGEARPATRLNLAIDSLPQPEVEAIRWDNGEGDTIEGVLYWPPGKRGDLDLPLVVDIHGGPWSLRTEGIVLNGGGWAYYPALLASRGYLVLEPNYRGGTGRGDAFLHAIEGYSCSRPATDVLTGVDHLVERGWADADAMGVMGYSYGGLMTNCLITRTQRFDAAASGAGLWNDISYFGTADNFVQNIVRNLGQPPWEAFENYWEESAASLAGDIVTPTIITIGGADRRVPTSQGYELYRSLVWLDVPAKLLVFPGEGHGFRTPSHKLAKVRAEIEWLDRYLLGMPSATND